MQKRAFDSLKLCMATALLSKESDSILPETKLSLYHQKINTFLYPFQKEEGVKGNIGGQPKEVTFSRS